VRKDNENGVLDVIPPIVSVIAAVAISRYFKMGFWSTFLCSLLAGLLVVFIVWAVRNINRKKLYALVLTEKPEKNKCRVTVLLWNPAFIKEIYSSDYGEYGLCFTTDYTAVIGSPKLRKFKWAKDFTFSELPGTAKNTARIHMGNLASGALVEFEFAIYKSDTPFEKTPSGLILPPGFKSETHFDEPPNVSIHCARSNINLCVLKYGIGYQAVRWICIIFSFLTIFGTVLTMLIFKNFTESLAVGMMMLIVFAVISFCIGNFVPPFVVKRIKSINKTKSIMK